MHNPPDQGHVDVHRETLEWMGRQLSSIKTEADGLVARIRGGDGSCMEAEIEELELRIESYRAKLEFEKRNRPAI